MLKRGHHEIYRKIYWITSIVKKSGLKKANTKNILADWGKLKCQEKVSRISVDCRWNPATIGNHSKLESWRRLQEDYKILSLTNCNLRSGVFTFSLSNITEPSLKQHFINNCKFSVFI